mmetsp:Transcript_115102/g.289620  ORF Transcript_115102/g.289620 Transcript_115102/m.289620 type:complete len:407 (+) Transcript_115102:54-1274(+)
MAPQQSLLLGRKSRDGPSSLSGARRRWLRIGFAAAAAACCSTLAISAACAASATGFTSGLRPQAPGAAQPRRWPQAAWGGEAASPSTALRAAGTGHSEWRLGVGRAIDVLRRDAVALFENGDHALDFTIFSEDIEFVDARLPSFRLSGLATYQRVLSTLRWSVSAACDVSKLEITATSPPVNNEVYMRWRLHLWPRDPWASAKGLFMAAPGAGNPWQSLVSSPAVGSGLPFIVEGYSRYEFDPWTAEIVKHTIDITNPPMYLNELLQSYNPIPAWLTPVPHGVGVPLGATAPLATVVSTGLTGATAAGGAAAAPATAAGSSDGRGGAVVARTAEGSWLPSMPQTCEDDFECNDGKANYPLQCCELPIVGKFCCEVDDFDPSQGLRLPAYVPLPVPTEEPWQRPGGR